MIGISIRNIDNVDALAAKSFPPGYERIILPVRDRTAAPIVLGGSGFSIFPGEPMSLLGADFGVVGGGESISLLATPLNRGRIPPAPRDRDQGRVRPSPLTLAGARHAADLSGPYVVCLDPQWGIDCR